MNTANMANIVELSSDELQSIEGGWDWGGFAGGVAYSLMIAAALTAPMTPVGWAALAGTGVALYLN